MNTESADAMVIGAGPAGLMAAEELLSAGYRVILAEARPSPGRKLLMAGKSGLNLTMDEPLEPFLSRYCEAADWLRPMIAEFGPEQVKAWARDLSQPVFTGSSGRVFPAAMKASPLLRAWLARLSGQGLDLRLRWRWTGMEGGAACFDTPQGPRGVQARVVVLALGGASWKRLGSDGAWADILARHGVPLAPFRPANMGVGVSWSAHMAPHFGQPLKAVAFHAGLEKSRGEAVITARGLEGGGIYAIYRPIRDGEALRIDLFPDQDVQAIADRLRRRPQGESATNRLRRALGLSGARLAVAQEFLRPLPADPLDLAQRLKAVLVVTGGPFPMDGAISTAGGVSRAGLDDTLMLRALPGVFVAGEMLDWEAPTGGYLLTACLATGRWAGRAAARRLW